MIILIGMQNFLEVNDFMTKKVHLAGLTMATIFGFSFMFSKVALNYVSPIGLIAYRFLVAFFVFELLRQFKVIKIEFDKSNFKYLFLVATFQPILYFLFETYGLELSTSGEAGMMIALIPIFVTILSTMILKEKPRAIQLIFILLSVLGVLFIQFMKSSGDLNGELLGFFLLFGAVLSAALFNIASRSASKAVRPFALTYFMMLFGAVIFNLMYVINLTMESRVLDYFTNLSHIELLLPILYLGIVASIGGFFLVNFALSKAPAHITSIYSNLSTIVAVIAGALLLGETLLYYHYIGSLMIVFGVYGTVYFRKHQKMRVILPKKNSNH